MSGSGVQPRVGAALEPRAPFDSCSVCRGARLKPEILAVTVASDALRSASVNKAARVRAALQSAPRETGVQAFRGEAALECGAYARRFDPMPPPPPPTESEAAAPFPPKELSIHSLCQLSIAEAQAFVANLALNEQQQFITSEVPEMGSTRRLSPAATAHAPETVRLLTGVRDWDPVRFVAVGNHQVRVAEQPGAEPQLTPHRLPPEAFDVIAHATL